MPFSLKLSKRSRRYDVASKGHENETQLSSSAFAFKSDVSTIRADLLNNRTWMDNRERSQVQFGSTAVACSLDSSVLDNGLTASSGTPTVGTSISISQMTTTTPTPTVELSTPNGPVGSTLTLEERELLLPPYKPPPDYETFMRQKASRYSVSLCNLPSYLSNSFQVANSSPVAGAQEQFVGVVHSLDGAPSLVYRDNI